MLPDRTDFRRLGALAVPVITVQVGLMAMGVVDTIMVGHVSAANLAAVALGNLYFFGVSVFGMGTLMALDPVVAQAVGAGDEPAVARAIQRGLMLAVVLTVPISMLFVPAAAILRFLGQPPDVVPLAAAYVWVSIPGILPFLAFVVLRQSLQAIGRLRPIVISIVAANLINAVLCWALVFGHMGQVPSGAVGAGIASTLARWGLALGLLALAWRELKPHLVPFREETLQALPLGRMLRLGVPIGIGIQLEFGVFAVIALLMGRMGTVPMAAHQIAINIASLTFMVPLGISAAAAVLVGRAVGADDPSGARRAAWAALASGGAFMALSGLVLGLAPRGLAGVYSIEPEVVAMAVLLIPIAAVFQVFDGLQVVAIGILRGLGDTRTPMITALIGFWAIGFPISLWLGFSAGAGPVGLWWGLVAGLVAVSAFLVIRVRLRLARALRRVMIDEEVAFG